MQTNTPYLNKYFEFVISNHIQIEKIRWIHSSAYNYLYGAYVLAQKGLKNQAHNSARMGLEFHWMGLLLSQDERLLKGWCIGVGMSDKEKKKLEELEQTSAIIKKLGDKKRIKIKDRQEIYQALSDTSHVKFKNTCFVGDGNKQYGHFLGGFVGEYNMQQCLHGVNLCMKFILTELSEYYKISEFEEYNRQELYQISGSLGVRDNGIAEPHITSKGFAGSDIANAIALFEMAANPEEFLK